jgi:hypothetical protein
MERLGQTRPPCAASHQLRVRLTDCGLCLSYYASAPTSVFAPEIAIYCASGGSLLCAATGSGWNVAGSDASRRQRRGTDLGLPLA